MALSIEDIVAELGTVTILELNELIKAVEEKFGVSAAALVTVAGSVVSGAAKEQTGFIVELAAADDQKVKVIKIVRETTGLGLEEARAVADDAPAPVKEAISKEEVEALKVVLEKVGASVTIK